MDRKFEEWCAAVTAQVRFRPDHGAIEKELAAHYEDHVKDLERVGYDWRLAEQRALAAMGDPAEVGQALDRAHKPWLGWMWMASRWLLALALCLLLVGVLGGGRLVVWVQRTANSLFPPEDVGFYERELAALQQINEEYGKAVWTLGGQLTGEPTSLGGYTVDVVKGSWWDWSIGCCRAWCILRVEPDHFWYSEPADIYDDVRVVSSDGRELVYSGNRASPAMHQLGNERGEWFSLNTASFGKPEWKDGCQVLRAVDAGDMEGWYLSMMLTTQKSMEWMDLTYSAGGRDWTVRIDWEAKP